MSLLGWLDASPFLEAALTSALLVIVALLAVSVSVLPQEGPRRLGRSRWLFAFFVVLAIFAARWPSTLSYLELNPEESQMTAQAITIRHYPIPWKSYDTTTSGPLNSAVLVIPALFGKSIDFVSTRLVAIALILGTLAFLFAITRTLYGELAARLGLLLPLSFFCCVRSPDFADYTSEMLPMFLLAAAAYGLVRFGMVEPRGIAFTGFALGCLPFANLQSALLGFALFVVALGLIAGHEDLAPSHRFRCVVSLIAGICCVPVFILTLVTLSAAFQDFYVSYIQFPLFSLRWSCCKTAGLRLFAGEPFSHEFLVATIILVVMSGAVVVMLGRKEARKPVIWLPPAIALLLVPLSIYSIDLPQTLFQHSLILLFWPLCAAAAFAVGCLLVELGNNKALKNTTVWIAALVAFVSCGLLIRLNFTVENPYLGRLQQNLTHAPDEVTAMLRKHVRRGDRMAIWGWMPRYFVETGALMGTHDSVTPYQIDPSAFRSYFRARYFKDMRENKPRFFLDAVAPGSFKYKDWARQGHATDRGLTDLLDANYVLIDEANGVLLYQRNK